MAEIINGKAIAEEMNSAVREKIQALRTSVGKTPKLVSLSIGRYADAAIYVEMQKRTAGFVGIDFESVDLGKSVSIRDLAGHIAELNEDKSVTSVIVQKPLPEGIEHDRVVSLLDPAKDAEGIHPLNLGKILRREADIVPCTPGAVMKILTVKGVDLYGKKVVIIGHSAIVGKPLSLMFLNEMATTTVCHLGTAEKDNVADYASRADILVVAVGKAEMVKGDWISSGAFVIDVGINKVGGKIVGDVAFDEAEKKAGFITPVPGGVGPVTVSILMRNVLRAYRRQYV